MDETKLQAAMALNGWLHKKSPNFLAGWQKRFWMVAEEGKVLAYLDDGSKKGEIKGYILLKDCTSIQNVQSCRFTVVTHAREYELEAASSSERDNWVSMLWLLVKYNRKERSKSMIESPAIKNKSKTL